MHWRKSIFPLSFVVILLCLACTVKSNVIVDRSFLPRIIVLTCLLLGSVLTLRSKGCFPKTLAEWLFFLFLVWNLLSITWSICPSEALMQSMEVMVSFVLFLVISAFLRRDPGFENQFIKTLLVVQFFSFILGFITLFSLKYYNPYRMVSISANNNLYAGFLLIALPFNVTGYKLNRGFWKYFSVFTAILAIFFMIILQSRAVYLGLGIASLISGLLVCLKYREALSRKNRIVFMVSLLILVSGVAIFYSSLDMTRRNYFLNKVLVLQYFRSYGDGGNEQQMQLDREHRGLKNNGDFDYPDDYYENANLRVIFWKKSWSLIKMRPLTGVGSGNWKVCIPSVKDPPNPDHTLKNYTYSYPHNEWIGFFSELGLPGFLLGVVLLLILPGIVFIRVLQGAKPDISAVIYTAFVMGFCVYASFDFPFRRVEHTVVFFSMLAMIRNRITPDPLRIPRRFRFPSKSFGILLLMMLAFALFVSVVRIRSEYYTLIVFRNERMNDKKVIRNCQKAENCFYRLTPNNLPVAWFEGVARDRSGDTAGSVKCYQRALKSAPFEVRVLNDYGAALYGLKMIPEAKSYLLRAISLDPWFDDARYNLGAIYYWTGRRDSARYYVNGCRESQKKQDFFRELQ